MKWLDVIATAVPIFMNIIDCFMNIVDWIFEKFPSKNNSQPQYEEFCRYSTTA